MSDRSSAISNILGRSYKASPSAPLAPSTYSTSVNALGASSYSEDTGNYWLKVLYFMFLYGFVIFLVLLFVHYSITPVFRFTPGDKGYIAVPGNSDDLIYWNNRRQPLPFSAAPSVGDKLSGTDFINSFSFSVDLYITELTSNSNTRLILYKASRSGDQPLAPTSSGDLVTTDDFVNYMSKKASMIMYLTQTNDIMITFFSGINSTQYSIPYIKNVPVYTPFRVTLVVEPKMVTVYMNGKQLYQRLIPETLQNNSLQTNEVFYSFPDWANTPSQTVFVQNFHLWPRAITYKEIINAQPALALAKDFSAPANTTKGSCSS